MSIEAQILKGRKAAGLTQQQLADLLGVTRAAIAQWEKKAPKLRDEHILGLAKHLNMPTSAFARFGGDTVTMTSDEHRHSITLLNWNDLKHITGGKVLNSVIKKPAYLEVSKEISKRAIAFTINDSSMEVEFAPGEEIVIDPAVTPVDGDCVLVRLGTGEHLFRRYRPRNGAYDLVALNADWDTVSVSSRSPAEIIGTMVEHRKRRRAAQKR